MRENPIERLNRDVRVDRIWEGTSEIQRVIIGGQLRKRGIGLFTDWYGVAPAVRSAPALPSEGASGNRANLDRTRTH
jgi:hypothetical protein